MKNALWLLRAYITQIFLAVDQLLNALIPPFTGSVSMADETLSARSFRAYAKGRAWGLALMPLIDWLFAWQKPDPTIKDYTGAVVQGHCERAYHKEILRRNLPPEYREATKGTN
jgi:hypothetical protein